MAEQRLIDANEAIDIAKECYPAFGRSMADLTDLREVLEDCTTVDAKPVVHGRWETNSDRPDSLICSVCKCGFDMWKHDPHNYCPNCGAQMDESEDKNEIF